MKKTALIWIIVFFALISFVSSRPTCECNGAVAVPLSGCSITSNNCPTNCAADCSAASCYIDDITVENLTCNGNNCNTGNDLNVTIYYYGSNCDAVSYVYVNASSKDGICHIKYSASSSEIEGMGKAMILSPAGGFKKRSYIYKIPNIPANCLGKNISLFDASLWSGNTPNSGTKIDDVKSNLLTGSPLGIILSYAPGCGNGIIDTGEACDDANTNSNDYCKNDCSYNTCGDGSICSDAGCSSGISPNSFIEQCDDGNNLNNDGCTDTCKNGYFSIPGWTSQGPGWSRIGQTLQINKMDTNILSTSPLDIKADTNYTLTFTYNNPTTCSLFVILDKSCLSQDGSQHDCMAVEQGIFDNGPSGALSKTISGSFIIPDNSDATNKLFKNMHLYIRAVNLPPNNGDCFAFGQPISLDDVKLYESPPGIYQDEHPGKLDLASACCPDAWCWNGTQCVNSADWMDNAEKAPVWNLFNINDWPNPSGLYTHVNSSNTSRYLSYRCINTSTGASWQPSELKYDPDFANSGYCNDANDCFMSNVNDRNQNCLHNNSWNLDNFCIDGRWTSRSEVLAQALLSFSANTNNFTIICDQYAGALFNEGSDPSTYDLGSGCVLVNRTSDSSLKEQVLMAVSLAEKKEDIDAASAAGNADPAGKKFLDYMKSSYEAKFSDPPTTYADIDACAPGFVVDNFSICFSSNNLYVYWNSEYEYFIVTNRRLSDIDPTWITFTWTKITDFFKRLVGVYKANPSTQFKILVNPTAKYKQFYVMNTSLYTVSGVQESKYDEAVGNINTFIYINYTGKNLPITEESIRRTLTPTYPTAYINTTVGGVYIRTDGNSNINIWKYLTAMLRDR